MRDIGKIKSKKRNDKRKRTQNGFCRDTKGITRNGSRLNHTRREKEGKREKLKTTQGMGGVEERKQKGDDRDAAAGFVPCPGTIKRVSFNLGSLKWFQSFLSTNGVGAQFE